MKELSLFDFVKEANILGQIRLESTIREVVEVIGNPTSIDVHNSIITECTGYFKDLKIDFRSVEDNLIVTRIFFGFIKIPNRRPFRIGPDFYLGKQWYGFRYEQMKRFLFEEDIDIVVDVPDTYYGWGRTIHLSNGVSMYFDPEWVRWRGLAEIKIFRWGAGLYESEKRRLLSKGQEENVAQGSSGAEGV